MHIGELYCISFTRAVGVRDHGCLANYYAELMTRIGAGRSFKYVAHLNTRSWRMQVDLAFSAPKQPPRGNRLSGRHCPTRPEPPPFPQNITKAYEAPCKFSMTFDVGCHGICLVKPLEAGPCLPTSSASAPPYQSVTSCAKTTWFDLRKNGYSEATLRKLADRHFWHPCLRSDVRQIT